MSHWRAKSRTRVTETIPLHLGSHSFTSSNSSRAAAAGDDKQRIEHETKQKPW